MVLHGTLWYFMNLVHRRDTDKTSIHIKKNYNNPHLGWRRVSVAEHLPKIPQREARGMKQWWVGTYLEPSSGAQVMWVSCQAPVQVCNALGWRPGQARSGRQHTALYLQPANHPPGLCRLPLGKTTVHYAFSAVLKASLTVRVSLQEQADGANRGSGASESTGGRNWTHLRYPEPGRRQCTPLLGQG